MKEEIVKDLIARLMEEQSMTLQQAFDRVYNSVLFEKLANPATGLFFQSSGYVYSYLIDELEREHNAHDMYTHSGIGRKSVSQSKNVPEAPVYA